jgi:hypothetical protein
MSFSVMSVNGLKGVLAAVLIVSPEASSSRASRVERKTRAYESNESLDESVAIPSMLRSAATDVQIDSG